jgi:hypothetical protein
MTTWAAFLAGDWDSLVFFLPLEWSFISTSSSSSLRLFAYLSPLDADVFFLAEENSSIVVF